jgi:steroid delta-isomerase-like uncharacterized protein
MRKRQRVGLFTALALATVGTLTIAGGAANAQDSNASHGKPPSPEANKRVVLAFMRDVLDCHHGDHAVRYLTPGMSWHSGTVGTVSGSKNVAGLMTTVVTAIPDLHTEVKDIFAQGNKVVVRLVVTGTQKGSLLGVPASGRAVRWDAIDLYHLKNGKISEEWAGEDYVAFLNSTGTYKAPWIP